MRETHAGTIGGRCLLVLLTLYALALIVLDLGRIARPLGSFGLAADGDGVVYDVRGPFPADEASPAFRAGLRPGDRLDLAAMRCVPVATDVCVSMLALWGGLNYATPGRRATLVLAASAGQAPRPVVLIAEERPRSRELDIVLVLDQLAGILVVLGGAWLVWLRPGGMTWGFFAYVIQFNPGQAFQFYAWLQHWPALLLAQAVVVCVMQTAGYTGFLLFALRVPGGAPAEGRWRRIERLLPAFAAAFLVLSLSSLGSLFGVPSETVTRAGMLGGFAVDIGALAILLGRRRDLGPRDYQRIRWVIWGCLIGLPAFLIAQLSQATSLPSLLLGHEAIADRVSALIYLANGVLCLFVVEAVRRPTVVSVTIPLRRATVLGLLLSVPAFFLHQEIEVLDDVMHLPGWAWIIVASCLAFLIARLHEHATHLADRLFDLDYSRAEQAIGAVARSVEGASSLAEIERLLVDEPLRALGLSSAALFREEGGRFRRRMSAGWPAGTSETLDAAALLSFAGGRGGAAPIGPDALAGALLPTDLARPIIAVRLGNVRRCFAMILYGGHEAGTDLDQRERALLAGLATQAEIAYAFLEAEMLRARIAALEARLSRVPAG